MRIALLGVLSLAVAFCQIPTIVGMGWPLCGKIAGVYCESTNPERWLITVKARNAATTDFRFRVTFAGGSLTGYFARKDNDEGYTSHEVALGRKTIQGLEITELVEGLKQ